MRYRILGPLSVIEDGQEVAITAGRDRILLAPLLLHAPRVVDHAALAEALWGIGPPPTARSQLPICVSRLRRRLPPETILSDPAGYRLTCDPDDLDATIFTRPVARARGHARLGRYAEALRYYRRALFLSIETGEAGLTAIALINIQTCKREAGQGAPSAADRYLAAALRLTRLRGNRPVEAEVLNEKAVVLRQRGRHDEAVALHEAAIAIIRPTSDRVYEVMFLHDLAITRGSAGDRVSALARHRRAVRLAQAHGMAHFAARAEAGIADCLAGTDPAQARRSWLVALAAFRTMGVPEQYEMERRLAAMAE